MLSDKYSLFDVYYLVIFIIAIYFFFYKFLAVNETFANDPSFEDYISAIQQNKFTDKMWEDFEMTLLYYIYTQLQMLDKVPTSLNQTIHQFYNGNKDAFVNDMLKIYGSS